MRFATSHKTLLELAADRIEVQEDPVAQELMLRVPKELASNIPNEMLKATFDISVWKSPRLVKRVARNAPQEVSSTWDTVRNTNSPIEQVRALSKLKGVAVPRASALLTFWNPADYAVIDRYMIDVFHSFKELQSVRRDNIKPEDYGEFVTKIRELAKMLGTQCRQVELSIYQSYLVWAFDEKCRRLFSS